MIFSDKNLEPGIHKLNIGNQTIEQVGTNCKEKYFKFVGHVLDDKLSWEGHIQHIAKKTSKCQLWNKYFKTFPTPQNSENFVL